MILRFLLLRPKSEFYPANSPRLIALTRSSLSISDASIVDPVDTTIWIFMDSSSMWLGKTRTKPALTKSARRGRLGITESDHRLIESKLRLNELHTRTEIHEAQAPAISLFAIRRDDDAEVDVIPEELAAVMRQILKIELRLDSYRALMEYRPLRRKAHLVSVLDRSVVEYNPADTVDLLVDRVIEYVPSIQRLASRPEQWPRELNETGHDGRAPSAGDLDRLRPRIEKEARARWYDYFEQLAAREYLFGHSM